MILIFGAKGQLGTTLSEQIGEAPEHMFLSRDSRDYCGDITDTAGITETLMELRPEIIINAAAYTKVDAAESDKDAAHAANARAPGVMAQVAAKLGSLLVHYSTDYVFDGSGTKSWQETDPCHPVSVYGQSKLAGEKAITDSGCRHIILRSSWIYSSHGNNFLNTMLTLAQERSELRVVNDQWGVPTSTEYLSGVTLDLINLLTPGFGSSSKSVPAYGIYHCAPSGETNWFEYARLVINTAKSLGFAEKVSRITPVASSEYPTAARRPLNSRLNTSKLQSVLGTVPADWQEDVIATVHAALMNQDSEENDDQAH